MTAEYHKHFKLLDKNIQMLVDEQKIVSEQLNKKMSQIEGMLSSKVNAEELAQAVSNETKGFITTVGDTFNSMTTRLEQFSTQLAKKVRVEVLIWHFFSLPFHKNILTCSVLFCCYVSQGRKRRCYCYYQRSNCKT